MFVVRGGAALRGTVPVSGSKNAALPLMAAAIAADEPIRLRGVPQLADVATLSEVLRSVGVAVDREPGGALRLHSTDATNCVAPYDVVRKMRASVCVLGPLLGRRGRACVSLPGGCNIGHRPIDLHLRGLAALGARIRIEKGYVVATAKRLRGSVVDLAGPCGTTVTGTCNVMMAAVFAEGTTTITSAAREPEVVDLGGLLNACGARIRGLGSSVVQIEGVESLRGGDYPVIPDRIEAATLMMAAAATKGEVTLTGVRSDHVGAVIELLRSIGIGLDVFAQTDGRSVVHVHRTGTLKPVRCTAIPYPGLPTDVQAQLTSLMTLAPGTSVVTDSVFPGRFMHVPELCRMGADVRHEHDSAIVQGGRPLQGASVMASDLRASAALAIAGLAAEGETSIRRIYHLDRGYERLEEKLGQLGADVKRVRDVAATVPPALPELNDVPGFEIPPARAA